jgi:hypothetical protein
MARELRDSVSHHNKNKNIDDEKILLRPLETLSLPIREEYSVCLGWNSQCVGSECEVTCWGSCMERKPFLEQLRLKEYQSLCQGLNSVFID